MSVAKPILEYIDTIKVGAEIVHSSNAFKRLLKYHKSYVHLFIAVGALSLLGSYLFALEPLYTAQIIDLLISKGNYQLLPDLLSKIVLAIIAYGITNFAITYIQGYASQSMIKKIRSDYYSSLQNKSSNFYDSTAVGDLVSRATMDLMAVDMFLRTWIGTMTTAIFTVVIVFQVMYSISPIMSLITILHMPPIFYFAARVWIKTMPLFRKMQRILGKLGAYVQQNILGMKVVRIFQREDEMLNGFVQVENVYVDTAITAGKIQSKYSPVPQAILTLGVTIIYVYGGNLIVSPQSILTIGELILFGRYMVRLSFPLRNLSQLSGAWVNASAGIERIYEIMEVPVDVRDRPDAENAAINKGEVEFRNVTFGYVKDRPVLKNVSFKVNPGENIAILGATGSGKTSLVFLIPRFYDVDSGSIVIDGRDVRNYILSSLRKQIGLVLQDLFIFTGTLKDNIAFGKPDASLDEVMSVAKIAKIHDFIESLPEGYNTMAGERGVTLSGGQRQRLTIARVLLANPKILIFDDALSFVDARTEQEIQGAIEEAMKGRTTFIIAQRLSTIKNADKIMILDNGEVVEFGTHDELMAKETIYKRIYETQFLEKAPEEILKVGVK